VGSQDKVLPWLLVMKLNALMVYSRRLACMGALLTLLAVGIDPTVQQAIVIRTRHVVDARQAQLPRAQSIRTYPYITTESGTKLDLLPSLSMVGSICSAISGDSSQGWKASSDVVADCPTGNCTFPVFQTLAVCFECADISDFVKRSCFEWRDELSSVLKTCRSELPNSLHINQTVLSKERDPIRTERQTVAASTIVPLAKPMSYGLDIARFTFMNGTSKENNISAVSASQCLLYWCVKTLEAGVVDGRLSEQELNSWYDKDARLALGIFCYKRPV
jgi:hypothetical protein